jgi:hypothetical protein
MPPDLPDLPMGRGSVEFRQRLNGLSEPGGGWRICNFFFGIRQIRQEVDAHRMNEGGRGRLYGR